MKNMNELIVRIRQFAVLLVAMVLFGGLFAQNITRIEYFYDTDPGFGHGISVAFAPAANVSALAFSASITSLSYGFHTLYIRSRDANNKWSLTESQPFVRYSAPVGGPVATNIVKMEYFIDTDPGFGSGTNVTVTPALNISNMNFAVSLTSVSNGFHTLYVRTKDASGKWSLTQNSPFIKYQAPSGGASATNIVKMEYFIDADPGFGSGTNVVVTPALNISNQVFNVNLASVSNGFHTLYVRTKDASGKWALTQNAPFIKYQAPSGGASATNIVKMEYFIDADPGFGSAVNVSVTPALNIANQVFNVNLASVSNGFHTLYVRTMDANGKWAITNNSAFVKYAAPSGTAAAGKVTRIEYFIDTDPGFGSGVSLPFTHANNVSNLAATIDLTSLPNGFHTFYIRSMDTTGKWSITNYSSFSGGSDILPPVATIHTNGPDTFCLGAGTYLYATYQFASTYQWQLNNSNINGATNIEYIPIQTGNYRVILTNSIGKDTSSSLHVIVDSVPTANISANGPLNYCQGSNVVLSVNQTTGASYQWYQNGGPLAGGTNYNLTVTQSGVYYCKVTALGGCSASSAKDTVTVSSAPSATITPSGSTTFCTGDSVTLSVPSGGGLTYHWSTGATTNSIKVYSQATYSVTVTNNGACSATSSIGVTVVTAPTATITPNGPTTFCNGSSVVLSANTGAGLTYQWTGGASTSSITVTTSGTYYVTVSNTGCSKVSSPVTVTVNPGPTVTISSTAVTVCPGHPDTLIATGATTYAWSPSTYLNTSSGATVISIPSSTILYTVTGTTSGCIGTDTITVHVTPNNTSASTGTPNICSGASATLTASGASTYKWSPTGTLSDSVGASVTATPANTTTYTVTGTSGTCTSTASVTVNVSPVVVPSVSINTPQTTVCATTSVTFTASPTNGGAAPTYQWYKDGVLQLGNSSTFTTSSLANNDSVWCVMTSNATCPSPATATSNKVVMTITPNVVPTISISASQNPICAGDSIVFTASITFGGAAPTYQWKKNNITVGGNSATYTAYAPSNGDSVWCVLTSNANCATPSVVTSSKIHLVVNPIVVPTISVSASQNPTCAGTLVTFSASLGNGGSNPTYQWYKNGSQVSTAATYSDNTLLNNDSVWCVFTSDANCMAPDTAISNKVIIVIDPVVTPAVTVTTSTDTICAGTLVTFAANPANGGASPSYNWYLNGVALAGNTNTFASSTLHTNDSVWCIMTSSATCPVPTTATSNKVYMTVNAIVVPSISITVSQNPVCAGDTVTFSVSSANNGGSTPGYQWLRNGLAVGSDTSVYSTTGLNNNDSVWCVFTSSAVCPSPASINSNKIHMSVNPIVTPGITVNASQTTICAGGSVTFTASASNGGTPVYQWYKDGNAVGSNSSVYIDNTLADGDSVWCVLTSNANCQSTDNASSNKVIITIATTVTPSVTINTGQTTVCSNTSVTFTASANNGGTSPSYRWFVGGVQQAGNTSSFSTSALTNNDMVWCIMYSNAQCVAPDSAYSDTITMTVNASVVPTIGVDVSQNPVCTGDSVTFTANITNGGNQPTYQWYVDGILSGNNQTTFGSTALSNNDSVWCVITSDAQCVSPVSLGSNKTYMIINPVVTPTVVVTVSQNPACAGAAVTFTANPTYGGNSPSFQWYKNSHVAGNNSPVYIDSLLSNNDTIWCVLTSNANCLTASLANSNPIIMSITPNVIPTVSLSADQSAICNGNVVTYSAISTNGGSNPTYQWYNNGFLLVGLVDSTEALTPTTSDSIWCIMSSNATCASPASVSSNGIVVGVLPPAYYSFNQSICQGDSFVFNGRGLRQAGVYNDTLVSGNGCDSIITLSLAIIPVPVNYSSAAICTGETYTFDGHVLNVEGVYNDTLTAVSGCDSINVLSLSIYPTFITNINASVCQGFSYSFNGQNLTASGTYSDTTSSINGCDSILMLTLTVLSPRVVSQSVSICEGSSYTFGGQNLTQTGVYNDTTVGSNGCDSITTLNLIIIAKPSPVIIRKGTDTLQTSPFANYEWLFNNSPIGGGINQTIIINQNGSYSVFVVDASGCSDTSASISISNLAIDETSLLKLSIYPNPTEGLLYLVADEARPGAWLELRDDLGRLILTRQLADKAIHETLNLSDYRSGIYLLSVRNANSVLVTKRIVKN